VYILNIYGRLVRCNVSTDRSAVPEVRADLVRINIGILPLRRSAHPHFTCGRLQPASITNLSQNKPLLKNSTLYYALGSQTLMWYSTRLHSLVTCQ